MSTTPSKSSTAFVATIHIVLPLDCESSPHAQEALSEVLRTLMFEGNILDWGYVNPSHDLHQSPIQLPYEENAFTRPPIQPSHHDLDQPLYTLGIDTTKFPSSFRDIQKSAQELAVVRNQAVKIWKHIATVKPAQVPTVTEFL